LHPPKTCFPRYNPFPNVTLGDWDNDIIKIDWDNRFRCEVKRYSRMMCESSNLVGFMILESSSRTRHVLDEQLGKVVYKYKTKSYHTVFNEPVSYDKIISCLAWLCMVVKDQKLTDWFLMQLIKGTFTLRHGFKGKKSPPRIVYRYGSQDKQIKKFLDNRKFILDFFKKLEKKGD